MHKSVIEFPDVGIHLVGLDVKHEISAKQKQELRSIIVGEIKARLESIVDLHVKQKKQQVTDKLNFVETTLG